MKRYHVTITEHLFLTIPDDLEPADVMDEVEPDLSCDIKGVEIEEGDSDTTYELI